MIGSTGQGVVRAVFVAQIPELLHVLEGQRLQPNGITAHSQRREIKLPLSSHKLSRPIVCAVPASGHSPSAAK
ncbi:hypothetical protein BGLA2_810021 [Burkholderia gladioli]|nr:hypothetical protein BGLA2_810021 [Burkholderia gladioli]